MRFQFDPGVRLQIHHQAPRYCARGRVSDGGANKTGKDLLISSLAHKDLPLFMSSGPIHGLLPLLLMWLPERGADPAEHRTLKDRDVLHLVSSPHLIILVLHIKSDEPVLFVCSHKSLCPSQVRR